MKRLNKLLKLILALVFLLTLPLVAVSCSEPAKEEDYGLYYVFIRDSENSAHYEIGGLGSFTGTQLTLPERYNGLPVKGLLKGVFAHSSVQSITISTNLTYIEDGAFMNSDQLKSIYVKPASVYFKVDGNCLIEKQTNRLITAVEDFTIPSYVESIADYAFYGKASLTGVVIPSSVKKIGDFAFMNCHNLQEATLNEGLVYINQSAFYSCNLKSLDIPSTVQNVDSNAFGDNPDLYLYDESGVLYVDNWAIGVHDEIVDLTFIEGTVGIAEFAFCDAANTLTTIVVPASLKYIGRSAFYACRGLTSAVFENYTDWQLKDEVEDEEYEPADGQYLQTPASAAFYLYNSNGLGGKYWFIMD